jgi:antitoxin component of MazEF toxin-antitoxin module
MATAHIKKLIKIGGSLAIILPSQWVRGKLKPGEEMVVVGNGELRIFPAHPKDGQVEEGNRKDGGVS